MGDRMKRYCALIVVLLFYASILPWPAAAAPKARFSDLILEGGPWVDVRASGAVGAVATIQTAINTLDNAVGGDVFIPAGRYIGSSVLDIIGKDNVTIRGAGKGRTVLDFTGQATLTTTTSGITYAPITVDVLGNAVSGSPIRNFALKDLTIISSTAAPADVGYQKSYVALGYVDGVTIENVEFIGGYGEGIYIRDSAGGGGLTASNVRILRNDFKNNQSLLATGLIDTNTLNAKSILIDGNTFDNVWFAIAILGENIRVVNNSFKDISGKGIEFGESNGVTTRSLTSSLIANNTFIGLGKNPISAVVYGITVDTREALYTDNTQDIGLIIDSNTFVNSCATNSIVIITATGPVSISNNYVSNIVSGSNADTYFFKWDGYGTSRVDIWLKNNILHKSAYTNNFNYGMSIAKTDNTYIHLSNNYIDAATIGLYYTNGTSGGGYWPTITYSGDIFNTSYFAVDNVTNAYSENVPVYGSTAINVTTPVSSGLRHTTLDNTATPSVAKGKLFQTVLAQPAITNLTNGVIGQEVIIMSNDNVVTMTDGGNLKLAGNWTPSAAYQTIRLQCIDGTIWIELSRSAN